LLEEPPEEEKRPAAKSTFGHTAVVYPKENKIYMFGGSYMYNRQL
jgi:hypothetical protein